MLTEKQIEQNMYDVRNAIAQSTLEGLTVSEDVVLLMEKSARGEISLDDCLTYVKNKYKKC